MDEVVVETVGAVSASILYDDCLVDVSGRNVLWIFGLEKKLANTNH